MDKLQTKKRGTDQQESQFVGSPAPQRNTKSYGIPMMEKLQSRKQGTNQREC